MASTYPRWIEDHEPAFVHELCRRLLLRFEVIALVPCAPGAKIEEILDGVQVHRYRYAPRVLETLVNDGGIGANLKKSRWKWLLVPCFVVGQLLALRRLIKRREIDLVHAHWLIPQGFVAALANKFWGVPFVCTSHGADVYSFKGKHLLRMKNWIARRAKAVSVVGEAMRKELGRAGLPEGSLWVRSMGADLKGRFVSVGEPREQAEILFVGRLVEKKGLRYLIAAMPNVLDACPDATLAIAGFGPEMEGLERQVEQLGLAKKIRFLGPVPQAEVARLLHRAALAAMPFVEALSGDQEGLPLALLEAIGCGCPVVAGNVAGVIDIIGPPDGCNVVDPRNTGAFAKAIVEKLTCRDQAIAEAKALRARVVDYFDWDTVASDYADWLDAAMLLAPKPA